MYDRIPQSEILPFIHISFLFDFRYLQGKKVCGRIRWQRLEIEKLSWLLEQFFIKQPCKKPCRSIVQTDKSLIIPFGSAVIPWTGIPFF